MPHQRCRRDSGTSSPTTSGRPDPEDRYWTAYARGANFEELGRLGFTVFYPVVDDYVFLRAVPENRELMERGEDLGIEFLLEGEVLAEVAWRDLAGMSAQAAQSIGLGDPVEVVRGKAEGLRGRVIELTKEGIRVRLDSYRRTYEVTVDGLDLVLIKP